jgi:hypothetical protein
VRCANCGTETHFTGYTYENRNLCGDCYQPMVAPRGACPQCGGSNVQVVAVDRRSVAKSVLAELALGTAGGLAAGSSSVVQAVCLACGATWVPGTSPEQWRALRGLSGPEAQQEAELQAKVERLRSQLAETKRSSASRSGCLWVMLIIGALAWLVEHL